MVEILCRKPHFDTFQLENYCRHARASYIPEARSALLELAFVRAISNHIAGLRNAALDNHSALIRVSCILFFSQVFHCNGFHRWQVWILTHNWCMTCCTSISVISSVAVHRRSIVRAALGVV